MFYFIFYSLAPLFDLSSARSLYSDSSEEDLTRSHLDLETIKNAAQIINRLQELNEQSADIQALQGNKQQGIDLDYLGFSGEHFYGNRVMDLLQQNNQANRDWQRTQNPRVYYISNPEVLEQYWKKLKKQRLSSSSESADRDRRVTRGTGTDVNLLKYLINLRRDGDDTDDNDAAANLGENRLDNDNNHLDRDLRVTVGFIEDTTKFKSLETTRFDLPLNGAIGFKSNDFENNFRSRKKSKSKLEHRAPSKVGRHDDDTKKSIESFKSAWKMKKETSFKERNRDGERKKQIAISKPKERLRSNHASNDGGSYHAYGRTPVPIVGKRGIYEED